MLELKSVIKKELKRFLTDRRIVFSSIILPGLLIYIMYSIMGNVFEKQFHDDKQTIKSVNMPVVIKEIAKDKKIKDIKKSDIKKTKKEIKEEKTDALIVFPNNFENEIGKNSVPNIEIYYNSASENSYKTYTYLQTFLNAYESSISNVFDINNNSKNDITYDLASDEDTISTIMAGMLPMLLVMLIFAGAINIASESIAGEKERGTLATILVTPLKRNTLAFGKIISLSIVGLLSAASSTIGIILSIPNLLRMQDIDKSNVYGAGDYIRLAIVIISTMLVVMTILAIISSLAKNVKEANSYMSPVMILSMIVGISCMFSNEKLLNYTFLIPIYNSVNLLGEILKFNINITHFILTIAINIIITFIGIMVLSKLFKSEKIIYTN